MNLDFVRRYQERMVALAADPKNLLHPTPDEINEAAEARDDEPTNEKCAQRRIYRIRFRS